MNRSKGTYLQGLKYAEILLEKRIQEGKVPSEELYKMIRRDDGLPSYYYDGNAYCDGFYDYVNYYLDNKELMVNHFKGVDSEI